MVDRCLISVTPYFKKENKRHQLQKNTHYYTGMNGVRNSHCDADASPENGARFPVNFYKKSNFFYQFGVFDEYENLF